MSDQRHIWDRYADWNAVGSLADSRAIRTRITGLPAHRWQPNGEVEGLGAALEAILAECQARRGHRGTVVDFGCGLGRNQPFLRGRFDRLVGFDLPEMAAKLRADPAGAGYDAILDDRAALLSEPVDVIFDSVVWQHIIDADYTRRMLDDLLVLPGWRWLISFTNAGVDAGRRERGLALGTAMLRDRGWSEILRVEDTQTFRTPHVMRVLRRPDPPASV